MGLKVAYILGKSWVGVGGRRLKVLGIGESRNMI